MPLYNADVPVSFGDRDVDSSDANVSLSGKRYPWNAGHRDVRHSTLLYSQ